MAIPLSRLVSAIISRFRLPVLNKSNLLDIDCISCNMSKSHKLSFSDSSIKASAPLEYLFCDVWGPSPVNAIDGSRYYLLIVDAFSRYCWVFTIHLKSQVSTMFQQFHVLVEKTVPN